MGDQLLLCQQSSALDPAGSPRVGFEVQLWSGSGGCSAGVRARLTRFATFPDPTGSTTLPLTLALVHP